jgi:hypothetical protein
LSISVGLLSGSRERRNRFDPSASTRGPNEVADSTSRTALR